MAAEILDRFDAGTEITLIEGSKGILDIAVDGHVVFSKDELGIKTKGEVNAFEVGDAIEQHTKTKTES